MPGGARSSPWRVPLPPNGFVLDVAPSALLPDEHALLMHRLAPARPDPDEEWPV